MANIGLNKIPDLTNPQKELSIDDIVKLATQMPRPDDYVTKPTNAGDIASSVGSGDWGGALNNALKYLNTAEGKTILSGTSNNPYEKQAWLGQAGDQRAITSAQMAAYMDAIKGTREGAWKYATEEPVRKFQVDSQAMMQLKNAGLEGEDFAKAYADYQRGVPIEQIIGKVSSPTIGDKLPFFGNGGKGKYKGSDNVIPSGGIKTGR